MVEVPDYSFISKDTGPSLSQSMGNWLNIDKNVYDLKEKGANEAIGNILQQSTDAQGNVDYGTANALAAKAGPRVQMGMQTMLAANSARRGEQINQGAAINTNIARAGASLMQDSSDANVDATIDNLIATNPGQRQLYEAERQRLKAMNPQQRVQYSYQHVLGQLDGADQLLRGGYGAPTATNVGPSIVPTMMTPASPYGGARMTVGAGGVTVSMTPAEANQPYKYKDSTGTEQSTTVGEHLRSLGVQVQIGGQQVGAPAGAPNAAAVPKPPANYVARPAPVAPAATSGAPAGPPGVQMGGAPPAPPGATSTAPYTGGGIGSVLAPTAPGPRSDVTPPPNASVAAMLQGMQNARANPLLGGAMTAGPGAPTAPTTEATPQAGWGSAVGTYGSTPAQAPAVPAAAAPARPPAAPAVPPTPQQPTTTGRSIPGPVPGKAEAGQETGKQSAIMGGALITRGDQAPVQKANLQNMMTDLAKLDSMGPGTDKEIFLNSVMQKLTGYGFSMNRDQVAAGNSFAKLANIAVGQQLAAIGGTDARQSLFMGSNPHLDMSKLGNERIIQMLMGNEDAIQAKSRAWTAWSQSHGDDTYRQFQDDFNRHFDPRVFQSQYMARGGPELEALKQSLLKESGGKTDSGAYSKFKEDTAYARNHGWIQ